MLEDMRCPETFVCNYVCPTSDWSAYAWIMWIEWLFFLMIYLTAFFVFPVLVASACSVIRQRHAERRRKSSSSHYSFQSFQAD
ncbi:MAG: uncharacterized protein KVP18_003195 [Porospora cf. gigantea A]|nr:MAG: hypothetical protein KVP18_003195 [Porospora cf. gigantea A]